MSLPIAYVVTKVGMFIGEVDTSGNYVKIYKPMQVSYKQTPMGALQVGVSPYPPGVKDLVDDLENFCITFHSNDVMCYTRPSDSLKNEYVKGSNVFRNIQLPTTGEVIDVGIVK